MLCRCVAYYSCIRPAAVVVDGKHAEPSEVHTGDAAVPTKVAGAPTSSIPPCLPGSRHPTLNFPACLLFTGYLLAISKTCSLCSSFELRPLRLLLSPFKHSLYKSPILFVDMVVFSWPSSLSHFLREEITFDICRVVHSIKTRAWTSAFPGLWLA